GTGSGGSRARPGPGGAVPVSARENARWLGGAMWDTFVRGLDLIEVRWELLGSAIAMVAPLAPRPVSTCPAAECCGLSVHTGRRGQIYRSAPGRPRQRISRIRAD